MDDKTKKNLYAVIVAVVTFLAILLLGGTWPAPFSIVLLNLAGFGITIQVATVALIAVIIAFVVKEEILER